MSGRSSFVVPSLVAAASAGLILGACSRSGDNLTAAPNRAPTTVVADTSNGGATASTVAAPPASVTPGATPDSATDAPTDVPTVPQVSQVSIVDVPEVGVPGLDSTDAFCSSWSRFAGSFQVVAVNAAFGSGTPEQLAALEVAAAPTVTGAYDELLANWPAELASEYDTVADESLGPFARRLAEALDSLSEVGANDVTITAIAGAWVAGLARRDPSTPEFVVDLPDEIWQTIDEAATVFGARLVPFGSDPSLVTDVRTPLTTEYLGVSCPDQGTLGGQEVDAP